MGEGVISVLKVNMILIFGQVEEFFKNRLFVFILCVCLLACICMSMCLSPAEKEEEDIGS